MFVSHQLYLPVLGLCALSALVLFRIILRKLEIVNFKRKHGAYDVPPVNFPTGLFGLAFAARTVKEAKAGKLYQFMKECLRKSGPTYQTRILGNTIINTVDVENVRSVLTNVTDYGVSNRMYSGGWSPFAEGGIFVSDGHEWQVGRAMVRPAVSRGEISQLDKVETHVAALIKRIPHDGRTVDLQEMFLEFTLDSAMDFLLGVGTRESLSPAEIADKVAFASDVDFCGDQLLVRMRTPPLIRKLRFWEDRKFKASAYRANNYISQIVSKHAANLEASTEKSEDTKNYILANELLRLTDGNQKQTCMEVGSVLIAARDTTALLLSHVFYVLARRPDVWAKLQKEVAELGGRKPDFEMLKSMRYLKYVLNETLRYYAIVANNARWPNKDVTIPRGGGPDGTQPCFVPKDAMVVMNLFAMLRDKNVYGPDADEFRPERWGVGTLRPGWYYLPFGAGPRVCPGQQFALTEASYTIVRLMQEFPRIESHDPRPYLPRVRVSVSSANGVLVGLFKDAKA